MSIHQALKSHLLNDSDVALIVEDRVFRTIAPRGAALPRITFQRIDDTRERHMTAVSGHLSTDFDLKCWAATENEAIELADAVRRSLDHKHHTTIGLAPFGETISAAFLEDSFDDYEAPSDASDDGIHVVVQSWTIWHTETIPELAV